MQIGNKEGICNKVNWSGSFGNVKDLLLTENIPIRLDRKFVKCFVQSTVTYGSQMWTIRRRTKKYFKSFNLQRQKQVKNIKWTVKTRNYKFLSRIKESRNVMRTNKNVLGRPYITQESFFYSQSQRQKYKKGCVRFAM